MNFKIVHTLYLQNQIDDMIKQKNTTKTQQTLTEISLISTAPKCDMVFTGTLFNSFKYVTTDVGSLSRNARKDSCSDPISQLRSCNFGC